MAAKNPRPVLIQEDHEYIDAYFSIPTIYKPEHSIAEIRRYEGMKEVLALLKEKFTCPS